MEFLDLELIENLVVDPNLTHVAERYHLTQSALSKRLHHIEDELGFKLFDRLGPKGLRPTPQAHEMSQLASQVLKNYKSGLMRVTREAAEPSHLVLLGPPLFLREVVLPWWTREAKNFPDKQLEVRMTHFARVPNEVIEVHADAAILEHQEDLPDFVCKEVFREKWGMVRNPVGPSKDEFSKFKWGTFSMTQNPVDFWLVQRQKMAPPVYSLYWEDLTAVAMWVAETPGAASVLPWHSVAWLAKKKAIVFDDFGPNATKKLYLAYPKGSPHHDFIQRLLAIGNSEIGGLKR